MEVLNTTARALGGIRKSEEGSKRCIPVCFPVTWPMISGVRGVGVPNCMKCSFLGGGEENNKKWG